MTERGKKKESRKLNPGLTAWVIGGLSQARSRSKGRHNPCEGPLNVLPAKLGKVKADVA